MNDQETINKLFKEAVNFLAYKNSVSKGFILDQIASLDVNLLNQINELVMAGVAAIWDEYHK